MQVAAPKLRFFPVGSQWTLRHGDRSELSGLNTPFIVAMLLAAVIRIGCAGLRPGPRRTNAGSRCFLSPPLPKPQRRSSAQAALRPSPKGASKHGTHGEGRYSGLSNLDRSVDSCPLRELQSLLSTASLRRDTRTNSVDLGRPWTLVLYKRAWRADSCLSCWAFACLLRQDSTDGERSLAARFPLLRPPHRPNEMRLTGPV